MRDKKSGVQKQLRDRQPKFYTHTVLGTPLI